MSIADPLLVTDKRLTWVLKAKNQHHFRACECETHTIAVRELIEENIMGYCLDGRLDFSSKFSILSLGSGALLEEYVILKKMIYYGFTNIEMTLIEQNSRWNNKFDVLDNIVKKINLKGKATIFLSKFNSFREFTKLNPVKKYDMVFAIDFEDLFDNWPMVLTIGRMLAENGKLYLTAWNIRLTLHNNFLLFVENKEEPEWLIKFNKQNKVGLISDAVIRYGVLKPKSFVKYGVIDLIRLISKGYQIKVDIKTDNCRKLVEKVRKVLSSLAKFCPKFLKINIVENFDRNKYDLLFPRM